jgi:hypothetical protein
VSGPLETVLFTCLGMALILIAAQDIFDALFHPEGRARLSRLLMRAMWRTFRSVGRRVPGVFPMAGPAALMLIVGTWAALLVFGWAFIFLPHVPEGFRAVPALEGGRFVDALSVSLVTLTTLGFGDITPTEEWLRIVAPLEALVGFGLLSASISWLLLIYPALSRRRSLAYEITLLSEAQRATGIALDRLDTTAAERLYAELTSRVVAVERDLVSFPVAYYFPERDQRFSLAAAMPTLLELAERGSEERLATAVHLRAAMLTDAIRDFARTTAQGFHGRHSDSTAELLAEYARDQLRRPR